MNKDYKPIEIEKAAQVAWDKNASSKVNFSNTCLLYTSPSPRD